MKTKFSIMLTLCISAIVIGSISIISGCALADQEQPAPSENTVTVVCKDPRPTICTREYRPVCGHFADGTVKTFSNACSACGNKEVVGYTHGACSK